MHLQRTRDEASGTRRSRARVLLLPVAFLFAVGALLLPALPAGAVGYGYVREWGRKGASDGEFLNPVGVAIDGAGDLYVADTGNHRIQKFSSNGTFLVAWGGAGKGPGQFSSPRGVAVDRAGNVYVADTGNHRVQKFTSTGSFVTGWGSTGKGPGQFSSPQGIAVDAGGNVYVADTGNSRVQKFTDSGAFLATWGVSGKGDGQFTAPQGIAVDGAGTVYVADTGGSRIQKFTGGGEFLGNWGSPGSPPEQFASPRGATVDSSANVYVADTNNNRIQKFTSAGVFLGTWGSLGSRAGEFFNPAGVAVDRAGQVFVVDSSNHRVQVFAVQADPGPALTGPADSAALPSLGVTFSWANPSGTTQYQIQVVPANNDGPAINLVRNVESSFTLQPPTLGSGNYILLPGMTYTWRVRTTNKNTFAAEDDPSWSAWSVRTFRTPPPSSDGMQPVSPPSGATVGSPSPVTLQWSHPSPAVYYYEIQVSGDQRFDPDPATATSFVWWNLVHGGVSDPLNSWQTPPLEPGRTYYWRVRPRVQGDGAPVAWSATWSFTTGG